MSGKHPQELRIHVVRLRPNRGSGSTTTDNQCDDTICMNCTMDPAAHREAGLPYDGRPAHALQASGYFSIADRASSARRPHGTQRARQCLQLQDGCRQPPRRVAFRKARSGTTRVYRANRSWAVPLLRIAERRSRPMHKRSPRSSRVPRVRVRFSPCVTAKASGCGRQIQPPFRD